MPGAAFADSFEAEIKSFKDAMFFNGHLAIFRATGIKAAMFSYKRTDPQLIESNQ